MVNWPIAGGDEHTMDKTASSINGIEKTRQLYAKEFKTVQLSHTILNKIKMN